MSRVRVWSGVVLVALALIAARTFEPGVRIEGRRLEDRTAALHFRGPKSSGKRALLLHGETASKETMTLLGEALAAGGYEVLAVDLPGHSQSSGRWLQDPATRAVEDATRAFGKKGLAVVALFAALVATGSGHTFAGLLLALFAAVALFGGFVAWLAGDGLAGTIALAMALGFAVGAWFPRMYQLRGLALFALVRPAPLKSQALAALQLMRRDALWTTPSIPEHAIEASTTMRSHGGDISLYITQPT